MVKVKLCYLQVLHVTVSFVHFFEKFTVHSERAGFRPATAHRAQHHPCKMPRSEKTNPPLQVVQQNVHAPRRQDTCLHSSKHKTPHSVKLGRHNMHQSWLRLQANSFKWARYKEMYRAIGAWKRYKTKLGSDTQSSYFANPPISNAKAMFSLLFLSFNVCSHLNTCSREMMSAIFLGCSYIPPPN